jgi:hypothetical protein
MKNLSVTLVAILLSSTAFANEVKVDIKPLILASAEVRTPVSTPITEGFDLAVRVDQAAKEATAIVSAKIDAELSKAELSEKLIASVEF